MRTIEITQEVGSFIRKHAERIYPNECCGFLFGKEEELRHISMAIEVDNNKEGDQRRRFEISPLDYMKAEHFALENDLELLGIYHSHPNHPAVASQHDLERALPYFSYIIVSVRNGVSAEIQSWRLQEETRQFEEENIRVLTNSTI